MAKDTLRNTTDATVGGLDQVKPGTVTGSAAKGYSDFECDGSSYNKFGNRADILKHSATNFK